MQGYYSTEWFYPIGHGKTLSAIKIVDEILAQKKAQLLMKKTQSLINKISANNIYVDEYYLTYPTDSIFNRQPTLMSQDSLSTQQDHHTQAVLKRQRKFKKSKKQRPDDRHYELGAKPSLNRLQSNQYQHQGHNKMQFACRR
jgi:hypothetical protein